MKDNNCLPSYQSLLLSVRSANQSGVGIPAQTLFSTRYVYSDLQSSVPTANQYLRLIGSGTANPGPDFSAVFGCLNGMFLIDALSGVGYLSSPGANCLISSGSLVLVDGNTSFSLYTKRQSWVFRIFFLSGTDLALFLPYLPSVYSTQKQTSPMIATLFETLVTFPGEIGPLPLLTMHCTLTNLLSEVCTAVSGQASTHSQPHASYLQDMHAYIHDLRHRAFSLASLESRYGISRYRLCREYQMAFHTSPLKDFNHIRILEAKKLLLTTNLQVQEISSNVGYDNVSHFIHLFKSETGQTPNAFRHIFRT